MHVLHVTPRYPPNMGGVETVVEKTCELLVANGIKMTVYSADLSSRLTRQQKINGVLVKRFAPLFGDPLYLPEPRFITDMLREKADIIHAHNAHTLTPFIAAISKHGKQRFVIQPYYHGFGQSSFRQSLLGLYRHGLDHLVFPRADLVIANSPYEKAILLQDFPVCRNIISIPLGMNLDEIKRVKHNPDEPKRILYVGALKSYKNVDKVLDGFAALIKRGSASFKLVIVGQGVEHESLVRQAENLGVSSLVEWKHGLSRQQLLNEYSRATVFILLSHLESYSLVVYEALMIGVPAVVLNSGPLSDLVKKGLAEGVNSLDRKSVADAILTAMKKTYTRISETNTCLEWKDYAQKIADIYNKLL